MRVGGERKEDREVESEEEKDSKECEGEGKDGYDSGRMGDFEGGRGGAD